MGFVKEAMLQHEGHLAAASAYLVELDMLKECEMHGVIYDGGYWELESDFWRKVMNERNLGENGKLPWAADLEAREFTDIIKEAYETHCGDECGYCAKLMAD